MSRLPLIAVALLASANAFAFDVLIVHQSGYVSDVEAKLLDDGRITTIDLWDTSFGIPDAATMASYDAVFTIADGGWDVALMGDTLADYVDGGGAVVQDIFAWTQQLGGRWATDGYPALTALDAYSIEENLAVVAPHPVTAGFNAFTSSVFHSQSTTVAAGGTELAWYDSGFPVVAVAERGAGRVVTLNMYSPSSDIRPDFWVSTTDGATLMVNALLWAADGGGFSTSASGSCGGPTTISTTGATPNGMLAYASGTAGGTAIIPNGACAGTQVPVGSPRLRATRMANGAGADTINIATLGAGVCGATYVVVDLSTCAVTSATLP